MEPVHGTPTHKLGSVGQLEDGRHFVLFERSSTKSVEVVWQAITDKTLLAEWFPEIDLQAEPGGRFAIWFTNDRSLPPDVQGHVTVFDPPHVLQFGTMRFELASNAAGCTIRFSDVLDFSRGRSPLQVTHAVLAGWHRFMDLLENHLAGRPYDASLQEPDYREARVSGMETLPDQ